ncbi:MAG TPA: glycosyl hydrolase family 28 protein [Bacteroidales bacterium]|nr:glycosyl hydrolase family 28 protein [Bacteroidales bacterium]
MILRYLVFNALAVLILSGCNTAKHHNSLIDDTWMKATTDSIVRSIQAPAIPGRVIDLVDFSGHTPDAEGHYDYRTDIQDAIDQLASAGGGTLLFSHSKGPEYWLKTTEVYRVDGPIELRSNIQLLFDTNTRLQFVFNPENYLHNGKGVLLRYEGTTVYSFSPLIRAFKVNNVKISARPGSGAMPVIDGDGEKWVDWSMNGEDQRKASGRLASYEKVREVNHEGLPLNERHFDRIGRDFLRPPLLQFFLCKNVMVEGIKLNNSPFWVVHPVFSENLIFRDLFYDSNNVNNDGVDVETSKNVLIENINFYNHDDNVVIKAGRDREGREGLTIAETELGNFNSSFIHNGILGGPTTRVVVRNCIFKGHHAFCIGSEMSGGAHDIYVHDCQSIQNVYQGVYLKSSRKRGGEISHIYIKNLRFNYLKADVISIIPNYDKDTTSPWPPLIKNIYLENIHAVNAGNGIRVFGWFDRPTENIFLDGIVVDSIRGKRFSYGQVENLRLRNVEIMGKTLDGTYNLVDKNINTPVTR